MHQSTNSSCIPGLQNLQQHVHELLDIHLYKDATENYIQPLLLAKYYCITITRCEGENFKAFRHWKPMLNFGLLVLRSPGAWDFICTKVKVYVKLMRYIYVDEISIQSDWTSWTHANLDLHMYNFEMDRSDPIFDCVVQLYFKENHICFPLKSLLTLWNFEHKKLFTCNLGAPFLHTLIPVYYGSSLL